MGSQLKDALLAIGLKPEARTESKGSKSAGQPSKPRQGSVVLLDPRHQTPPHKGLLRPQEVRVPPLPEKKSSLNGARTPSNRVIPAVVSRTPVVQAPVPVPARPSERRVTAAPQSRLLLKGEFRPHPLFLEDSSEEVELPVLVHDGLATQLTQSPENAADLNVGLDFGTSATKVVIRDLYSANGVYPVPFDAQRDGVSAFLLPSRVHKKDGVYALAGDGAVLGNLKLKLLDCKAKYPVTEFNDCCAFLALVIRQSRAWLLTEHEDAYRRHALEWRFNLGIAAKSYEDKAAVDLFRRLAWAAANLAGDADAPEVTEAAADVWRKRSGPALSGDALEPGARPTVDIGSVDVVPEVSAQLQGFMQSARWNWSERPIMMLVDIGAGTVDSAMFHVKPVREGKGQLTFYACRVEANGVMNLHRHRVSWLQRLLPDGNEHKPARQFLDSIVERTDRLRPIPEAVNDYLGGYEIELAGESADDEFLYKRYRRQVAGTINVTKIQKGLPLTQLQNVPLLLCGGGSRMSFYSDIGSAINSTPNWCVSVDMMRPPVPQELAEAGWHPEDFDRISVAYGLSLAGQGETSLGAIVRAIDVPDAPKREGTVVEDRYVSKDDM
ncbi:hypothetical protein [Hydrogenophaga sp.]|uniref:hypothetical protein n=1 Tax=Hydrogenophaga sp. TaxID=1904254 RepID=UPI00273311EB|nr:hypothetical protein [Hydrogenophaga sp.]MDP3883675.1 hypothetical protein [Hydrogenophaga sp.]